MNTLYRKQLPGTQLDYFDASEAVEALQPGAWPTLPYTARVFAENIVRRADPATIDDCLRQLIERRSDRDFPWYPARVVCHDILGQTALVDLAGLRDAIAKEGGDPALVNPVVPVQLIVDHSLAVECGGFDPDAFAKNRAIEDRRNEDRFHFIEWTKKAFANVDVIPAGNGIMHQINLEKMSPVVQVQEGVAYPDTCVGTDSHTPHVDALGVIAIGVGGLEAENVMLGRASMMRLPEIVGVRADRPAPGRHHRHRCGAGAHRVFAQGQGGGCLPGVLWRRRCQAHDWRPRHHLEHGTRIRRHGGLVQHRRTDAGVSDADGPRGGTSEAGRDLCQGSGIVVRHPPRRRLRAQPGVRSVERGAQSGWTFQPPCARGYQRTGCQRHRRPLGHARTTGRHDARWRRGHCRYHQLHQHLQPAQRDRRSASGAQRQPAGPHAQALGQDLAGARLQGGGAVFEGSGLAGRPGSSSALASSALPAPPATA